MLKRQYREQSALEYLMTYGWMILIIAIVLVTVFSVISFEPKASFVCLGGVGFICSAPELSSGGAVVINITEAFTYPITVTGLNCNVTPSSKPPSSETTQTVLYPNQPKQLVFQCPLASPTIGSTDDVFLWLYYNTSTTPGQKLQQQVGKGILPVTYGGAITWDVNEWTPASNAVGLFVGYGTSGIGWVGPRNGYMFWENASPSIYSVNSLSGPNNMTQLQIIGGLATIPSGYNIWSANWSVGNEQMDINYVKKESATNSLYNPTTQLNQLAFVINPSSSTPELDAYWVRDRQYPPNGKMLATSFGSVTGSSPSYVQITLTNSQSTPTVADFQQNLIFHPTSYSSHEQSDLGNIRFYSNSVFTTQNELYSWCESNCSSSATGKATFWVLLPFQVTTTNSIWMTFWTGSNTEYDGLYAGEAPQLSAQYAEYDNGAQVFNPSGTGFYDNFQGTSLAPQWFQQEGISATVNNGLQLSGGVAYGASIYATIPSRNSIVEADYEMLQTPTTSPSIIPYADLSPNLGILVPSGTTVLNSTTWESFQFGTEAGWAYGTNYHNLDLYNGIQTTLFPLHQLAEDDAPCGTGPWASHGYTAEAVLNMSGKYTFTMISDDGAEMFYNTSTAYSSASSWNSIFAGAAWQGEPPTEYSANVNFAAGRYEIVADYIDTCDPAGVSVVLINPSPAGN